MSRSFPIARATALLALALTLPACLSDGGNGENGLVRFSLVSDFVATEGLDHPVAAGGTVMVALQRPETSLVPNVVDPPVFTTLTLEARSVSGAAPVIYPAGIAQFGVYFPGEGEARLVAREGDKDLDWIKLTAVKPDRLSLEQWGAAVFDGSEDGVCASVKEINDISSYQLPPNAAAYAYVVPRKGNDALMGLLALTVESVGDGPAEIDALLLGQGLPAHAFQLIQRPGNDSLDDIVIRVTDGANGLTVDQKIKVRNDQDDTRCN